MRTNPTGGNFFWKKFLMLTLEMLSIWSYLRKNQRRFNYLESQWKTKTASYWHHKTIQITAPFLFLLSKGREGGSPPDLDWNVVNLVLFAKKSKEIQLSWITVKDKDSLLLTSQDNTDHGPIPIPPVQEAGGGSPPDLDWRDGSSILTSPSWDLLSCQSFLGWDLFLACLSVSWDRDPLCEQGNTREWNFTVPRTTSVVSNKY